MAVDYSSVKQALEAAMMALRDAMTAIEADETANSNAAASVPADQMNVPPETRDAKALAANAAQPAADDNTAAARAVARESSASKADKPKQS